MITTARPIAPEDIRPGIYIAVSREIYEYVPRVCAEGAAAYGVRTYSIELTPCRPGRPLRVVSVCLPYVLVTNAHRRTRAIDVRRSRIVRIDDAYAREARRRARKDRKAKAEIPKS